MSTLTIASNTNWSGLEDTSTSAVAVSLAAKTLTVSAGKAWVAGMPIAITAVGTKLHTCLFASAGVTSYSGTTLQLTTNGYTSSNVDVGFLPSMWGNFANQALSSSSVVVSSSGSKVFWTRPNLSLVAGDSIRAVFRTTVTTFIEGTVATYDSATGNLVMTAASSSGSGTVTDWLIISAGTISNWIIHPVHNDTISVNNGVTLTIDQTNYGLPANVSAIGTGIVYIPNVSTSGPIIFRLSCRAHSTNFGRLTIQQNASFKTRGNYIQIATGTGSALSYAFPSAWDAMSAPTLVEVETASGSGVYERWPVMGSMFYSMGRYGHIYGGEIGKTPTNLVISKAGGGTGIGTLGTIVAGSGYGGVISTLGAITAGTGGTTGTYTNVPLTVSSGTVGNNATANITVSGGGVVAVQIVNPGSGYSATSVLSAARGNIGGTTGFSIPVSAVLTSWAFSNVALTGGTGSGATAHITITLGAVTAVEIVNSGTGYTTADSLSASTTDLGAGTLFSVPITLIGTPLGTFKCTGGSGANGIITISSVSTSAIGRLGAITAGSGYVNGTYTDIPLKANSGTGAGARATIVVSGGAVTSVTLTSGGSGYGAGNTLTVIDNTYLGSSGSGFTIPVSTLANCMYGAYFSGYDGAPSAYAAGDLLTIECGGSIKPICYVAEVGDFANTTPATNIINSICSTAPVNNSIYQAYFVYSCTGGSGTGAKYVFTSGAGTTKTVGSQFGYFVAGTGYAVNDILTIAEGGMQVQITEISNALSANFTNKVCSWDANGRTLRFGADPDSAAVPNGAKVRVPNICIDALPVEIPLIQSVTDANPTLFFESATAVGTTFIGAAVHCEYETMLLGTKTANTMPISTRGYRGTRHTSHAAGAIVTQVPAGRAAGAQRAQFNTSTGGEIDVSVTMFGYWFQFLSTATRNISATNVGWSGALSHSNTTGPVIIDKFCNSCHPFQQNEHQWNITAIQNNLSLSNGVCAQVTGNDTNASTPYVLIQNCPTIYKFSNIDAFTIREWRGDRRSVQISNCSFVDDSTSNIQYVRCVGGMMILTSITNTRAHHLSFGMNCGRTVNATSASGTFSYTNNSNNCVLFSNCNNVIVHNINFIAQPPKGDLIALDAGSSNVIAHTGNDSSGGVTGYVGNGAFSGINLTNRLLSNLGLNAKVANLHCSNYRVPFSYIANNTQTANVAQNIRNIIELTTQGGTQIGFVSTALNLRNSTSNGLGHGSLDSYDYVSGYTPFWATGGSMTPNLPDATWFMNLVDAGLSPTTGRIAIGCGGPNSQKTQYVVTGSNNSYPDNGGRFFVGGSGDIVEFTNWYPLRGITGFQSINPASNYGSATVSAIDGWYRFTISAVGSGYTAGTLYSVTGGSGYGGTFYVNTVTTTGITTGMMSSGIGYQVGDILTVGGLGGTITLTAIKTIQVRMVPWGQSITSASYVDLTYANLQAAFAAMTGYSSNTGLQIQFKVAADANTQDLFGFMNWYEIFTTVDSTFSPPIGYVSVGATNANSGATLGVTSSGALQGSTIVGGTGAASISTPYTFDGSTISATVRVRQLGYISNDTSVSYALSGSSTRVNQLVDTYATMTNSATIAAYTTLDTLSKFWDYLQYYSTTSAGLIYSALGSINSGVLSIGSLNLVINASASSAFSYNGTDTITIKASALNIGTLITSLQTTGTITFLNAATTGTAPLIGSNGKSGYLVLTVPSGASVVLYNNASARVTYVASSSGTENIIIPYGSTGTWTYKIAKYGYLSSTGTVVVTSGGQFAATISLSTDLGITQGTVGTVAAYGSLNNPDQLYDYAAYNETLTSGIDYTRPATKVASACSLGSLALVIDAALGSVYSYTGGTVSIKSSSYGDGTTYSSTTTSSTVTYANGAVTTTVITSSAGTTGVVTLTSTSGASTVLYSQTGTRLNYTASYSSTQTYYVAAGITGNYTLKAAKYGFMASTSVVTVTGGGRISLSAVTITTDTGITQATVGTVAAYATLGTLDKFYDYAAYYETTSVGIDYARPASKVGTQISLGSKNLSVNGALGSVYVYSGAGVSINTTALSDGATFTSLSTTGTVDYSNGGYFDTIISDSTGTTGILKLLSLNSHNIYVSDNSAAQKDYQTGVSGTYTLYILPGATGTWQWRSVKYGQVPTVGTFTATGGGRFSATPAQVTDSSITQATLATVLGYTTLDTWDKFYDYCQAYLTTSSGKTLGQFATKNGAAVDIGSYALTVDASASSVFALSSGITIKATTLIAGSIFSGGITSSTVSTANAAIINTWYTSSAGRSVLILAPSIVSGSRAWLYNVTSSSTIDNSISGSGGVYVRLLWTVDSTVKLTVTSVNYLSLVATGVLTNTGLTFLSVQSADNIYINNGVNGASCDVSGGGEFTADLPNVQIDINDSNNITYLPRIYAWVKYYETTSSGIISFLNAVTASDTSNYAIDGTIVDLALDNKKTDLLTVSGGYISKTGGTSLVALTTTGSIYFDSGKAYVAPSTSSGATLAQIEGSTILAKEATVNTRLAASSYTVPPTVAAIRSEMDSNSTKLANLDAAVSTRLAASGYTAPDNTSVAAIKAKTDNLPASPAAVGSAMTLTSAYDAAKNAASQTSVSAIPTNPLLANDARLNNIDASISSRLAASSYTAPDNTNIAIIASKLPSAGANIAGEGAIAKNLDQVSGGGGGGGATLAEIEASTVLAKEASVQLSIALSA